MKKQLLTIVAALLLFPPVSSGQVVGGGFKAGWNVSDIPQLKESVELQGPVDVERKNGLIIGGFATIRLNDWVDFQPELLYAQKGLQWIYPQEGRSKVQLDYVDIPLLITASRQSGHGLFVIAGPSLNFNVRAQATDEDNDLDIKDDIEAFEVGLVAGGGFRTSRFLIEGRWIEGLTNTIKEADETFKHRSFAVLAGVRF